MNIDEHTVFLSSGDMWQGGSSSNSTKGKIVTDWMNYLGFEAMALGNHEFDWGTDAIRENVDIVFIDYLQLLGDDIINKEKKLIELKDIAQRKNVTIIVIGQVSRKMESILPKERLSVSWLKKHSNAWEYYLFDSIDRLIYVDRYEKRLNNKKMDDLEKVDVHVVKNKGTALGTIEYVFKKKPLKFEFTSDSKKVFYERFD
jgi:hypothetical protein